MTGLFYDIDVLTTPGKSPCRSTAPGEGQCEGPPAIGAQLAGLLVVLDQGVRIGPDARG
jgi:hypothetical protein